MSTDRKIKGHAGSYGVAKYGLFVFRISAQPGIRPTGLGGLVYHVTGQAAVRQKRRVGVVAAQVGAHRRRVCIGVAVFAQMTAGVIGADTYLLLLRWKGFLRLRSRYETVHRTVSPKFVARGARQIWSLRVVTSSISLQTTFVYA